MRSSKNLFFSVCIVSFNSSLRVAILPQKSVNYNVISDAQTIFKLSYKIFIYLYSFPSDGLI